MARATVMMGVPTFYTRLLQHPGLSKQSAKHMRLFVSGSAPLLADTHREWATRTGHAVLERYGMTETNMNTSNPYDGERVPGAVGQSKWLIWRPVTGSRTVKVTGSLDKTTYAPGDSFSARGKIALYSRNIGETLDPAKVQFQFSVQFERLFDRDGRAFNWSHQFASSLMTPTGLPIEEMSPGGTRGGWIVAAREKDEGRAE